MKCKRCGKEMIFKRLMGIPYIICLNCREAFSLNFFQGDVEDWLKGIDKICEEKNEQKG